MGLEETDVCETYTEEDYLYETKQHIKLVQIYMLFFMAELDRRAKEHDRTKLFDPEKRIFIKNTLAYKDIEYGSAEYVAHKEKVKPALDHHYAHNSHHPEHYPDGIRDMNLLDIVEMFIDWKAASELNQNDLNNVIRYNKQRFEYSDDLERIFKNTARLFNNSDKSP